MEVAVILCARQFGKSMLGALMAIEDCLRYPNRCILIIGPTIKQTVEIVAPRLKEIIRDAPENLIRRSKSENKWYIGESELVIGGFDLSSSSQRGKTVQNIYIEEIVDSNPDQYNDSMKSDLGPALTHSHGGKMIFLTTPPKIPTHPFLLETAPTARLSNSYYCYTIDDNAALNPEQYEACVRRSGGKASAEFRREYLCEVVRDDQTSIVPHFDRKFHVKRLARPPDAFYHTIIDFGGVRDKTVALLMSYDFFRNRILVLAEAIFPANTPTSEIIKGVYKMESEFPKIEARFADAPGLTLVDLASIGFEASLPHKNDWRASINQMQVCFSENQIEIHEACPFLIATLESGQFNKQKTDFERTQSLGHCDAAAALMYGIRMISRENPYPFTPLRHEQFALKAYEQPEEQLVQALCPKTFNNSYDAVGFKKFGSFKK